MTREQLWVLDLRNKRHFDVYTGWRKIRSYLAKRAFWINAKNLFLFFLNIFSQTKKKKFAPRLRHWLKLAQLIVHTCAKPHVYVYIYILMYVHTYIYIYNKTDHSGVYIYVYNTVSMAKSSPEIGRKERQSRGVGFAFDLSDPASIFFFFFISLSAPITRKSNEYFHVIYSVVWLLRYIILYCRTWNCDSYIMIMSFSL